MEFRYLKNALNCIEIIKYKRCSFVLPYNWIKCNEIAKNKVKKYL